VRKWQSRTPVFCKSDFQNNNPAPRWFVVARGAGFLSGGRFVKASIQKPLGLHFIA
jgi:hypothetical protein